MRTYPPQLAVALVALVVAAVSTPGAAYARKSLMEYGGRLAKKAHGRHANVNPLSASVKQSYGSGNGSSGQLPFSFPGFGQGSGMAQGFAYGSGRGRGRAHSFGHGFGHARGRRGHGGAGSYQTGAGLNAEYVLVTMRNGVRLQGNLLAQLAWSSGFAMQPVLSDNAGNYLVRLRAQRGSSNDPTALLSSIKSNPNVLDASIAFMGQTRQITAQPGDSISVTASDLIGSVNATSYQWTQVSGPAVQLAQPSDSTLSMTMPQTTASLSGDNTGASSSGSPPAGPPAASLPVTGNSLRLHHLSRPSLMAPSAHRRGYGYGQWQGPGQGQGPLTFELIAKDSTDRAYVGKVVIFGQPAATTPPNANSGSTTGGTDTAGGSTTGGTDTSGGATTGGTDTSGGATTGGTDTSGGGTGTTDTSGNTGLVNPTTGTPLATDPATGAYVDPTTGQDMASDPSTGLPIDPTTGQLIDPTTGLPVSGSPGTGNTGASGGTVSSDPGANGSGGTNTSNGGTSGNNGGIIDGSISAA